MNEASAFPSALFPFLAAFPSPKAMEIVHTKKNGKEPSVFYRVTVVFCLRNASYMHSDGRHPSIPSAFCRPNGPSVFSTRDFAVFVLRNLSSLSFPFHYCFYVYCSTYGCTKLFLINLPSYFDKKKSINFWSNFNDLANKLLRV